MRYTSRIVCAAAWGAVVLGTVALGARAEPLPRRLDFGWSLSVPRPGSVGAVVRRVTSGGAAARAGGHPRRLGAAGWGRANRGRSGIVRAAIRRSRRALRAGTAPARLGTDYRDNHSATGIAGIPRGRDDRMVHGFRTGWAPATIHRHVAVGGWSARRSVCRWLA